MKLSYSETSPFVRKVLVLAHETGLVGRIELKPVTVAPTLLNAEVAAENPLGKIPVLVLDDGSTLYDSPVIAEYLDALHDGRKLFPAAGPERWTALRRQAAADGLLEAAVLVRYETWLRPEERRWPDWIEAQMRKVRQTLQALEQEELGGGAVAIGEIAVACALGYLDFRFGHEDWRARHKRLARFYAEISERPSMAATRPPPG